MPLATIEELVADIAQGRMVILMDDEDRENEGDIIIAGECVQSEHINFMARHARGLICLPLSKARSSELGLDLMVKENGSGFGTKFTVSIEAATGVTTGISAADRARTIQVASARGARASDIVQPGHIFPLIAEEGGVLRRAGHTEAACDLAVMAGFEPAAAICEIMNDDGTMARRPDLERFAEEHGLKIGTISDLIHYRILHERTVVEERVETVETLYGPMALHIFRDEVMGVHHMALVKGAPSPDAVTTVRVHVQDTLRDVLGLRSPDGSRWSGLEALRAVAEAEHGVFVLLDEACTNPDLSTRFDIFMGRRRVPRDKASDGAGNYLTIGTGSQVLRALNVGKMRLLSSPWRFSALSGFGLEVVEQLSSDTPEGDQTVE